VTRTALANRSTSAYEQLRAAILSGRWSPGARLSTYKLADELAMSRTPVIEALKRLEADGLIEIVPQVGCRVLAGANEEIDETFLIRAALEGLACEAAAVTITADELRAIDQTLEASEVAVEVGDAHAYSDANRAFHLQIVRCSGLAHVERMLEGVWTLNRYQLTACGLLGSRLQASMSEHRAMFAALEAHDPVGAREAVDAHLRRCGREYRALVARAAQAGSPR
jgi:DNA-binding GntR family transcriptional regulator